MTEVERENRIFLVCASHPEEDPIMLGKRRANGYSRTPSAKELQVFFDRHENCPGGPDHFKLAHSRTPNWDQALPAPEVAKHVRLELVKTS